MIKNDKGPYIQTSKKITYCKNRFVKFAAASNLNTGEKNSEVCLKIAADLKVVMISDHGERVSQRKSGSI